MPRRLLRASRWFHKYVGLVLIAYAMLMGVSGIFVNHPEWIDGLSMPGWATPPQYHPEDFDRGALSHLVWSEREPQRGFLGGTEGVWETTDGGRTFRPLDAGYPAAPYRRVTHALLLDEGPRRRLLAGTECGLFVCELAGDEAAPQRWRRVALPGPVEPVRALLRIDGELVVCTRSAFLRGALGAPPLALEPVDCPRAMPDDSPARRVSLVWLLFDTHSGALLGLPGRLLIDAVGLVIVFLGLSAFWIWYYPFRRRRRGRAAAGGRGVFRALFRYHLKIGIWVGAVLLLLSITGLFMRPPMLVLPAQATLDVAWYPHQAPAASWHDRIHRALHDAAHDRVLVETSEGFWSAPDDLSTPFEPFDLGLPIHVMGSNTLIDDGGVLVGSFSGAFRRGGSPGSVIDVVTGQPAGDVSRYRSADTMVTGYFRAPDGDRFVSTFHQGVLPLGDARRDGRFEMPVAMAERFRMPLWNWMFELHNGRFFRDWIGGLYFLVPILGSLLFFALSVTGIYDWFALR